MFCEKIGDADALKVTAVCNPLQLFVRRRLFVSLTTIMTFDGFCICVTFCFLVVPFLRVCLPDLALTAHSTDERLVYVEIWYLSVGVNVE